MTYFISHRNSPAIVKPPEYVPGVERQPSLSVCAARLIRMGRVFVVFPECVEVFFTFIALEID